jgi:hypothetical protein
VEARDLFSALEARWLLEHIEQLRDWQRQVAEALGVCEGPGEGIPGFFVADAEEAARYAREATTGARNLQGCEEELERLRAQREAARDLRETGTRFVVYSIRDLGAGYVAADVDEFLAALDAALGASS